MLAYATNSSKKEVKKMSLFYCVKSESYKFSCGNDTIVTRQNRLAEIGRSEKNTNLTSARGDFAAFQILIGSDLPFTVNVGSSQYFSQYPDRYNYRIFLDFPLNSEMYIEDGSTEIDGTFYCDMLSDFIVTKDGGKADVYKFNTHVLPSDEDFARLYEKLLDSLAAN